MSEDRDSIWMKRLADGDQEVIAEIRDHYTPELLLFCQRMVQVVWCLEPRQRCR